MDLISLISTSKFIEAFPPEDLYKADLSVINLSLWLINIKERGKIKLQLTLERLALLFLDLHRHLTPT